MLYRLNVKCAGEPLWVLQETCCLKRVLITTASGRHDYYHRYHSLASRAEQIGKILSAGAAWFRTGSRSMNRLVNHSSASSTLPCHSRCLMLSTCFEAAAPFPGHSSLTAFVCCCKTVSRMVM